MKDSELIDWILSDCGPILRNRVFTEIIPDGASEKELINLRNDICKNDVVREWLRNLSHECGWHGAETCHLENSLAKLSELGIRKGFAVMDSSVAKYRQWLDTTCNETSSVHSLASACLAYAGYSSDDSIRIITNKLLVQLYETFKKTDFNFYVSQADRNGIPKQYHGKPILRAEYSGKEMKLPKIWDIYAIASIPGEEKKNNAEMIDSVIQFILDTRYQSLSPGHGYLKSEDGKWFHSGWAVNLPGYFGFDFNDWRKGFKDSPGYSAVTRKNEFRHKGRWGIPCSLIQRLELLSHFECAVRHRWFKECMDHLESFRTEKGTYRFPKHYLTEKSNGYWVTGAYMQLEPNAKRTGLEVENSFRMIKIRENAGLLTI